MVYHSTKMLENIAYAQAIGDSLNIRHCVSTISMRWFEIVCCMLECVGH